MRKTQLKTMKLLLLVAFAGICTAQNDITLSVFTVTSRSMEVQWSGPSSASSYKITATPKNSLAGPVFAQFSGNTVMGSLNSLSPNTVYTLQVDAMDNALHVLGSATIEDTTAPDIPSIIQVYSKNSDSMIVNFTEVIGATSYIVRAESLTGDFFSETDVSNSPGIVTHLQPYSDYLLSIMSVNSGGRSQPSYPTKGRTVVMSPQLNTSSPSNNSIVVTWHPVEHAVFYTLVFIQEGSIIRHHINTTNTSVTFDQLAAGTNYCTLAVAWDSENRHSEEVTACQITRPSSPAVSYVEVTPGRTLGTGIFWVSVQGASNYLAWTNNGQNCSTNNSFCYITPQECGQNQTVSVVAYNDAGPSSPSQPANYITNPCQVENIWVEEPSAGNCSVVWDQVPLVDYYVTFIKRDDGAEKTCNTTKSSCPFFCMCGFTYLTSVFPYNKAGTSLFAHVRNYTTVPCCPQDVTINLVSTETLEVTWSPVKGAEIYETTAAETNDIIHCNDTAPVCALSDLSCNTVYSVKVTPCSELRGCNITCKPHTQETAPCAPEILDMTQTSSSTYTVLISTPNSVNTSYTVTAAGRSDNHLCQSRNGSCVLTQLPCSSIYEVTAVATTAVGNSLPGFSKTLETAPCCPASVNVTQVTQAMTNVTWSANSGARSFMTTLMSSLGEAKCHTLDTHCLMGCITCGTNYSVNLEAISSTGHKSECKYRGFSSSACCPTGVKLYRRTNNSLRVFWRSSGPLVNSNTVGLYGTGANYTCMAPAGSMYCDIQEDTCGDVYTVVVAPVGRDGVKVTFCIPRTFSVPCPGSNTGMIISRRRRSLK
ncbi:fibronectin type III domain-containing protein 7 [Nothobranchius furzeri]|uniref:Fibronectin type III domain containing 7 n=1 Tax=Nothobranchius furzeri TaxID=105023 RepID=A0A1A8B9I2_NOTFU